MIVFEDHTHWPVVKAVCKKIVNKGYKAYLAGGCVRDALLKRPPNDFDVATDAPLELLEALFDKTLLVGKQFGVIKVVDPSGVITDVAIFRSESNYMDGRRPTSIKPTSPREDAERRDFTINALFYDIKTQALIDFFGGREDIKNQLIRTVGSPKLRFSEDYLRSLRAVRFSSQLGFKIEEETWSELYAQKGRIQAISKERVQQELSKTLNSENPVAGIYKLTTLSYWPEILKNEHLAEEQIDRALFEVKVALKLSTERKEDLFYVFLFYGLFKQGVSRETIKELLSSLQVTKHKAKLYLKALDAFLTLEDDQKTLGRKLCFFGQEEILYFILVFHSWCRFMGKKKDPVEEAVLHFKTHIKNIDSFPEPLVTSSDLTQLGLKGEDIGKALKHCFETQLEKPNIKKQELLKKVSAS